MRIPQHRKCFGMSHLAACVLLLASLAAPGDAFATVWTIRPDGTGDAATFQEAINIASIADTILLADGVYSGPGNVNVFVNKGLHMQSISGDPWACMIDGEHTSQIFRFQDGAALQSTLDGIGFRNGSHPQWGGAIVVYLSGSPIIRNCVVINSTAWLGGGVAAIGTGSPRLENCWILNNEATQGGGIYISTSTVTIDHCVFAGNLANEYGGGLTIGSKADVILRHSTVALNEAGDLGGGFFIHAFSTLPVEDSIIRHNRAGNGADGYLWDQTVSVDVNCSNTDPSRFAGFIDATFDETNDSRDPLICGWSDFAFGVDVTTDDMYVAENSPCLPTASNCGRPIGALGSRCEAQTPILIERWSSLKSRF